MAPFEPHKAGRSRLAPSAEALAASAPPKLPLHHHPVVAVSMVLSAACLAQSIVSQMTPRLFSPGLPPPTAITIHDCLFTAIQQSMTGHFSPEQVESALFIVTLSASILSAVAWYAVGRFGIGRSWGLWTGLLWAVHPSFTFLAQRKDSLPLLFLLTPLSLALLFWWRRSRRPSAALLAGLSLGLLALTGLPGLLALPVMLLTVIAAPMKRFARSAGVLLVTLGSGLALVLGATLLNPPFRLSDLLAHLRERGPAILDDGNSPVAVAARHELATRPADAPLPTRFLLEQLRRQPRNTLTWLGHRLWRATYTTSHGQFQRPAFALEMVFLIPALWGAIVALRQRPWRWTLLVCTLLAGVFWLTTGLTEPLARNLAPIGGIPILFALVGVADGYERLCGRRLAAHVP